MSNKSKNKKKKKNQSVDIERDFRNTLKSLMKISMANSLKALSALKDQEISNLFTITKEVFYKLYNENRVTSIEKSICIKHIDLIEEFIYARKIRKEPTSELVWTYREKITDSIKENHKGLELLLILSRLMDLAGNIKSEDTDVEVVDEWLLRVAGFTYMAAFYSYMSIAKLKNREIDKIVEQDNELIIQYTSNSILTNTEIEQLLKLSKGATLAELNPELQSKIMEVILYYTNVFGHISLNHGNNALKHTKMENLYIKNVLNNMPLKKDGEFIISNEELLSITKKKKYIYPPAGIIFDVLDKNSDVDSIRMKEDDINIYIYVKLKNNNNLYLVNEMQANHPIEPLNKQHYTLNFLIDKELINIGLGGNSVKLIGTILSGDNESELRTNISYLNLACAYIAYCNPNKFKETFRIYSVKKDTNGHYTKGKHYVGAFLRRLPKGQKCSEEARKKALSDGFDEIPDGFTFVSCANEELKNDAKAKRITIR